MGSKSFLDQFLGSFQLFQPSSGSSKLLLVDMNQGFRLGNSRPSSSNDLLRILGDNLEFPRIVDQFLVAGLEVMKMTGFFSHLLLHLFPLMFLSSEELIQHRSSLVHRASLLQDP